MSELRGVGIGLGVAQGPVARMAEPLPAPVDEPSTRTPDEELARVREAVAPIMGEFLGIDLSGESPEASPQNGAS